MGLNQSTIESTDDNISIESFEIIENENNNTEKIIEEFIEKDKTKKEEPDYSEENLMPNFKYLNKCKRDNKFSKRKPKYVLEYKEYRKNKLNKEMEKNIYNMINLASINDLEKYVRNITLNNKSVIVRDHRKFL